MMRSMVGGPKQRSMAERSSPARRMGSVGGRPVSNSAMVAEMVERRVGRSSWSLNWSSARRAVRFEREEESM